MHEDDFRDFIVANMVYSKGNQLLLLKLYALSCQWLHMNDRPTMPMRVFVRLLKAQGATIRRRPQIVYDLRCTYE